MEIIKSASKWGNGAGVILPRDWIGKQIKVTLIDRTEEIKKEVLDILKDDLEDILGIYLVGSYARGDEEETSDIDIIAISDKLKKEISSGKYNVSIYPIETVKKTIKKNPILLYPRIIEAKTIFNKALLKELLNINPRNNKRYIDETKQILKINQEIINLGGKEKISDSVIYSLVLRLRGILILKKMDKKKSLGKKEFQKYLSEKLQENEKKVIESYQRIKKNLLAKESIGSPVAERLIELIKEEIKNVE